MCLFIARFEKSGNAKIFSLEIHEILAVSFLLMNAVCTYIFRFGAKFFNSWQPLPFYISFGKYNVFTV